MVEPGNPEKTQLVVNGGRVCIEAPQETPLIYVLRNDLGLSGPQFGCGQGLCGACTVLVDDEPVTSCQLPLSRVAGKRVVTLEGLSEDGELHPVQRAFVEEQAMQCGMCSNGMIMRAAALVVRQNPSDAKIRQELQEHLCRCGSQPRIVRAVRRAASEIWE
jgi:nicotinate dehydrogenase subunit A